MPKLDLKSASCALATAALVSACHVPPPVSRAKLHISAQGTYELDRMPVAAPELPRALELRKGLGQASGLEVEIRASTGADMKAVRAAIGAAKQAHVRVSFAAEESPALRSIDPNAASPE